MEVTQTRLTNVYDSVEAYNAATTGVLVPYHVLVLAGFPAGVTEQAAELLGAAGPQRAPGRPVHPRHAGPWPGAAPGLRSGRAEHAGTNLGLDDQGNLTWDDPDFGPSVIEPDQMPAAARANPWLDAVGAAASSAARDLPFRRIAIPLPAALVRGHLRWPGRADRRGQQGRAAAFRHGRAGVHHGLVGGDVRMGKTNLLHVLISQLAAVLPAGGA